MEQGMECICLTPEAICNPQAIRASFKLRLLICLCTGTLSVCGVFTNQQVSQMINSFQVFWYNQYANVVKITFSSIPIKILDRTLDYIVNETLS